MTALPNLSALELVPIVPALIGAAGGAFVALIAARGKRRDDMQVFIDQLQEERNQYAELLREERAAGEARLDRMWTDKAASRQFVAELRAHIYNELPPPPPAPPAGYIE